MSNTDEALALDGVSFRYPGASTLFDGLCVRFFRGEIVALVGPSGGGKTTLLQLMLGALIPEAGAIGRHAARLAFVFQRPQLLPWRSALDNAAFGLRARGLSKEAARDKARPLLEQMGLGDALSRRPHQLSEGMKQRVNLARALLVEPDVLLMDEPFSALDAVTRRSLHDDLLARHRTGLTVIFATHALDEAVYLADRVLLLQGSPARIADDLRISLARPRDEGAAGRQALFEEVERLHQRLSSEK